jgi:LysM repeat protein
MLGTKYVVRTGDTLWDLAGKHLGDPTQWPQIFQHNNSMAVANLTGTRIVDPDLIFVGQVIFLPAKPQSAGSIPGRSSSQPPSAGNIPGRAPSQPPFTVKPPSAKPAPAGQSGRVRARPKVRSIPFKFDLPNVPTITIVSPTYIATIKLKGSLTIQSTDSVDFVTLSKKGFEISAKRESDLVFGTLISENKIGYNPITNEVTFESGLTSHANVPGALRTTAAAGLSTTTGLPSLKASIKAPTYKGSLNRHVFVAQNLAIEIEITPRPPSARPEPVPVPSARPVPMPNPGGWEYLVASALIVGAGVLIVATIAEDIVTAGAGIADDVPSFAAASVMFATGMATFQTVQGVSPISVEGHGVSPSEL